MKAIVFGASGQDGYYLMSMLHKLNIDAIGVSRSGNFIKKDIAEYDEIYHFIKEHQPDFIFHLAANSTTRHEVLFENHRTISTGTINILEAVRTTSAHTKVFISGSGLQFVNQNRPIKETDPFEARDPYSVSRIHSVYAARYFRSLGVKTYVGYFFNHDSPKRNEQHMTKKIAMTAKRIAAGSDQKLAIGDLDAIKEYTYAGDVIEGIWTLVSQDAIFEANISSGKGYSIKDWLQQCFLLINKNWQDHVVIKPDFTSPYKQLISDPSRILSLGWKPQVSFEELAEMMMQ